MKTIGTHASWVVRLALAGLIGIGTAPGLAAGKAGTQATKGSSSAAQSAGTPAAKPPAKKRVYSAKRSQSRKAKLARARAAALAREMAQTLVPRYKVDASGDLVPDVRAAAAIIYDPDAGQVVWEENSQTQRSIASITKMMTAVVFLENGPDLSERVTVMRSDVYRASTTHLRAGEKLTADDLLHLLLIASDNAAARALARVSPYGPTGFIVRMNEKALELGLESTHYADPSGLLSDNVSSAYDMALLISHVSADERIASLMRMPDYTIKTSQRTVTFRSTNHLLGRSDVDVRAGKTGFITKAGYCLATLLRLPQTDQEVAVVVLGARSNAGRFLETRNLFTWLTSKASTFFGTPAPAAGDQP
jgi:D-alanyl-D-alanine endopeptidase (penicillin-binding protein 7)